MPQIPATAPAWFKYLTRLNDAKEAARALVRGPGTEPFDAAAPHRGGWDTDADADLVAEMTRRRVHIKLYDEFTHRYGERPTEAEYSDLITEYKRRVYYGGGRHPRIEDVVRDARPDDGDHDEERGRAFWFFMVLLTVAVVAAIAAVAFLLLRNSGYPALARPEPRGPGRWPAAGATPPYSH